MFTLCLHIITHYSLLILNHQCLLLYSSILSYFLSLWVLLCLILFWGVVSDDSALPSPLFVIYWYTLLLFCKSSCKYSRNVIVTELIFFRLAYLKLMHKDFVQKVSNKSAQYCTLSTQITYNTMVYNDVIHYVHYFNSTLL